MLIVSLFGSEQFLMIAAGFVFYRSPFKKGSLVLQILIWSFVVTTILKNLLNLPRPTEVSASVELLQPESMKNFAFAEDTPGFPSGHVSSTTAFWGALLFLYPDKIRKYLPFVVVFLMALSRMYLGRHFLGDVLGGLALGVLILLISLNQWTRFSNPRSLLTAFWFIAVPPMLNFVPYADPIDCGRLLGANLAIYFLLRSGRHLKEPEEKSALFGFVLGILLFTVSQWVAAAMGLYRHPDRWVQFFLGIGIPAFIFLIPAFFRSKRPVSTT